MMISLCDSSASRLLFCTTSKFCHRLSERALFLSCNWTTGGGETGDPATSIPVLEPGGRFSCRRRCSISCCLEVSRYSWYRNAGGVEEAVRMVSSIPPLQNVRPAGGSLASRRNCGLLGFYSQFEEGFSELGRSEVAVLQCFRVGNTVELQLCSFA